MNANLGQSVIILTKENKSKNVPRLCLKLVALWSKINGHTNFLRILGDRQTDAAYFWLLHIKTKSFKMLTIKLHDWLNLWKCGNIDMGVLNPGVPNMSLYLANKHIPSIKSLNPNIKIVSLWHLAILSYCLPPHICRKNCWSSATACFTDWPALLNHSDRLLMP